MWRRLILPTVAVIWAATALWQTNKPLPPGLHVDSPWYPVAAGDVTFIADITAADAYGRQVASQAIFDRVLKIVRSAHEFIVLDYYLFNSQRAAVDGVAPPLRELSGELRDALIIQKRLQPQLQVLFITDPINDAYGSSPSRDLQLLRDAGVDVVITDLGRLRDSNFIYSGVWRMVIGWWSRGDRGPARADTHSSLPNPLDESASPLSLGAWLQLLNFKANQRKVVIADDGYGRLVAITGSANPHDASSAHSNAALEISGPSMLPLLQSELAIARFSGWNGGLRDGPALAAAPPAGPVGIPRARVLTEGAVRTELVQRLRGCAAGDGVDVAMFYLSDRGVVEALLEAARRHVGVRIILDPNKDAYGHDKSGIPNQPVASELVAASDGAIHVRWYRTHGEQFHTRLAIIYGPQQLWVTVGSANLTRRSLGDYNLEADVALEIARDTPLAQQMLSYFDTLWSNRASLGIEYTADFGYYADPSQLHYWLYRVMEGTGISTF